MYHTHFTLAFLKHEISIQTNLCFTIIAPDPEGAQDPQCKLDSEEFKEAGFLSKGIQDCMGLLSYGKYTLEG